MEPIYGNYLGIVINNEDPEERKRVQVFIPHLSNTLFSDWNNKLEDFAIRSPLDLGDKIVTKLKQLLPWAEAAAPIFGGSTGMTANTVSKRLGVNNSGYTFPAGTGGLAIDPLAPFPGSDLAPPDFEDPALPSEDENEPSEQPFGVELIFGENDFNSDLPENENFNGNKVTESQTASANGETPDLIETDKSKGGLVIQTQEKVARTRKLPLSPKLVQTLENGLRGTGLNFEVTSGGQAAYGTGGPRTGSTRHDNGNAADGDFRDAATGRILNPASNLEDRERISSALSRLRAAGIQGIGWDSGTKGSSRYYMGPTRFHLDIANASIWGANGSGSNAVDWVESSVANAGQVSDIDIASTQDRFLDPQLDARNENIGFTPNSLTSASGSPNGTLSVPNAGAKVWVFFYGGDIQKPVYFASAIEPTT